MRTEKEQLDADKFMEHLNNPDTGLTRMVAVGEKIQDSNGDTWKVVKVEGNIAYYDRPLLTKDGDNKYSMFIAQFPNGTFNKMMTLIGGEL